MERIVKAVNLLLVLAVLAGGGWAFHRFVLGGPALDKARKAYERGQFTEAVVLYQKAVEQGKADPKRPEDPAVYVGLGRACEKAGKPADAAAAYAKALELDENLTEARFLLGELYATSGRLEDGERELRKVIEKAPNHAKALYRLGYLHAFEEQVGTAIDYYERAKAADPTLIDVYTDLAVLYDFSSREDDGLAICKEAVERKPDCALAWAYLGGFRNGRKEFAEARKCANTAVGHDPNLAQARLTLGIACVGEKLLDAAVPQFRKALELRPDDPYVPYYLGFIALAKGNRAAAVKELETARERALEIKRRKRYLFNLSLIPAIDKLLAEAKTKGAPGEN